MGDVAALISSGGPPPGKAKATDFFGGRTADSVFSIGVSGGGATDSQLAAKAIIASNEREINRIRGYKVQLTPSDNQRLRVLRDKILTINERATNATASGKDFEDRIKYLAEADKILGKPSADIEADDILATLRKKIDDLLAPKLSPAVERRVKTLETLKASFEAKVARNVENRTPQLQLQNVTRQILKLTPARSISQLSVAEKREYDELARLTNLHVGDKLVLNSREAIRVADLQTSINSLKASLPPDTSGQPTAAAVARAYTRLA